MCYRRYGKRLALSDRELRVKSPAGDPKRDDDQQMLVFSDQACDCPEVNADQCQICAAFTVKMGAFVKICKKLDTFHGFSAVLKSHCSLRQSCVINLIEQIVSLT